MLSGPIARATLQTSVALGLRLVVQAATLLLVARLLGSADYGRFAGVAALAAILGTLATFGTHTLLLAEVARADVRDSEIFPFAVTTTLLSGALLFVVFMLLVSTVLGSVPVAPQVLVCIGAAELVLQPLLSLPSAVHQGGDRIVASQLLTTLPLFLRLASAVLVWLLQPADPLSWYAGGYLFAAALAVLAGIRSLGAKWPRIADWRLPSRAELARAAGYAVLNLTAMGPAELDKTLALKLLPTSAAGIYSAGARAFGALTLPVIAMMLAAMPRLFREGASADGRSARLLRWIFFSALSYSIVLMGLLWWAAPLIESLFGARFSGMTLTIRWLTFALPGIGLRIAAGSALMSLGAPWMRVLFESAGLSVLLVAALALGRQSAAGMPIALGLSETTMAILGWWLVSHALARAAQGAIAAALPE